MKKAFFRWLQRITNRLRDALPTKFTRAQVQAAAEVCRNMGVACFAGGLGAWFLGAAPVLQAVALTIVGVILAVLGILCAQDNK
jgi:hypothetical protein